MSRSDTEMRRKRKRTRTSNDLVSVTSYSDDNDYVVMADLWNSATTNQGEATLQYIAHLDEKLDSALVAINSKITQVLVDFTRHGQQLENIVNSRTEEVRNGLKNMDENLKKLFDKFQIYRNSHYETDSLREFEVQKQKFISEFVKTRRNKEDVLASVADRIKQLNRDARWRRETHEDLQDRIAAEGRMLTTTAEATTSSTAGTS